MCEYKYESLIKKKKKKRFDRIPNNIVKVFKFFVA